MVAIRSMIVALMGFAAVASAIPLPEEDCGLCEGLKTREPEPIPEPVAAPEEDCGLCEGL